MKKKYKCRRSATAILVKVKDKVRRLEFEPDVVTIYGLRGCSYETDNVDIQHAVERHQFFGIGGLDGIWTDDKEEEVPVVVKEESPKQEEKQESAEPQQEEAPAKRVVRRKKKEEV